MTTEKKIGWLVFYLLMLHMLISLLRAMISVDEYRLSDNPHLESVFTDFGFIFIWVVLCALYSAIKER